MFCDKPIAIYEDSTLIIKSTCGNNCSSLFNITSQELEIVGNCEMFNFNSTELSPWNSYQKNITSLLINENITTIGSYSFVNCSSLINVTIESNVTTIGEYAFSGCSNSLTINYKGNKEPNCNISVFNDCLDSVTIIVPNNYSSDQFCGIIISNNNEEEESFSSSNESNNNIENESNELNQ